MHGVLTRSLLALCGLAVLLWPGNSLLAGSETPPEGPPWQRKLEVARRLALEANKPIFVYFTKTY